MRRYALYIYDTGSIWRTRPSNLWTMSHHSNYFPGIFMVWYAKPIIAIMEWIDIPIGNNPPITQSPNQSNLPPWSTANLELQKQKTATDTAESWTGLDTVRPLRVAEPKLYRSMEVMRSTYMIGVGYLYACRDVLMTWKTKFIWKTGMNDVVKGKWSLSWLACSRRMSMPSVKNKYTRST